MIHHFRHWRGRRLVWTPSVSYPTELVEKDLEKDEPKRQKNKTYKSRV